MQGVEKTLALVQDCVNQKRELVEKLHSHSVEASVKEPLFKLIEKTTSLEPDPTVTYILRDENGVEVVATLVDEGTVFDATENDIREGKRAVTDEGAITGTKVIPSYNTIEGYQLITIGSRFAVTYATLDLYDFTKLQAIICPYNSSISESVAAEKVAIDEKVYAVNSTAAVSEVTKNSGTKQVDLGITNNADKPYLLRYFMYKEIK